MFLRSMGSFPACHANVSSADTMLLGYMRVSKADGSQVLDMQRDALLAAGVHAEHLYEDFASGSLELALD